MTLYANEFRSAFLQEAREHTNGLEQGLLALEQKPNNSSLLNDIFRAAHSIKGAAGTLGFNQIAEHTHAIESLLDPMREGRLKATSERITVLLQATDHLRKLLDACEFGGEVAPRIDALVAQLKDPVLEADQVAPVEPDSIRLACGSHRSTNGFDAGAGAVTAHTLGTNSADSTLGGASAERQLSPAAASGAVRRRLRLVLRPTAGFFATGLDPILVFRDLARLGQLETVACDTSRVPTLSQLLIDECFVSWTVTLVTEASDAEVRDTFLFVAEECPVTITAEEATPASTRGQGEARIEREPNRLHPAKAERHQQREASTLRVASEKVDAIIDLVGELVIAQSMVMQLISGAAVAKTPMLRDAIDSMSRNMQELQERVMSVRMVPISTLFGRFSRVVRDTSARLGKSVHLCIEGQDTEIDKAVIELLVDPITHLVRNALDHGLETDAVRASLDKHEPATLTLRAQHVAGGIVIEVSDNGRGLDGARIRAKAEQLGLVASSDSLSDEQVHALIFEPGFSTATAITDLSGRGVGLDVVRRCVDAMNGTIGIVTQTGSGTTFQIRLPLTLAILDGLLLGVGDQTYVLPLLTVVESFRPQKHAVKTVVGAGTVVAVRDTWVPLLDLGVVFGLGTTPRQADAALVVVVEAEANRIGLVVDCLVGQSQVVVKSIETNYRKVEGILGATILGDGQVAFILDIACLVRLACAQHTLVKTRAA